MDSGSTVLINFNCPRPLKKQFDQLVRYKNLSKTSVILGLIEQYVLDEADKMARLENLDLETPLEPIFDTGPIDDRGFHDF